MPHYEYEVKMACGGCASAIKKAVTAIPNVQSVEASVKEQTVNVVATGDVTFD
ncbi:ATX1 antioxidant protein 1 [Parahypoxylon ruwenzoriense]